MLGPRRSGAGRHRDGAVARRTAPHMADFVGGSASVSVVLARETRCWSATSSFVSRKGAGVVVPMSVKQHEQCTEGDGGSG